MSCYKVRSTVCIDHVANPCPSTTFGFKKIGEPWKLDEYETFATRAFLMLKPLTEKIRQEWPTCFSEPLKLPRHQPPIQAILVSMDSPHLVVRGAGPLAKARKVHLSYLPKGCSQHLPNEFMTCFCHGERGFGSFAGNNADYEGALAGNFSICFSYCLMPSSLDFSDVTD